MFIRGTGNLPIMTYVNNIENRITFKIEGRKLDISLVFIKQSYFKIPKVVTRTTTHFVLLLKLQIKKNLNKLHIIIHQISTLKTLWIFTKNLLQNHILFKLLIKKFYTKIINLKYQLQHGINNLKYLMNHILYQIFKITSNIS